VSTPNGTTSDALVAADVAHVIWAVNIGCIGFHVWPSQADDQEHANELRIDLDPSPAVTFPMIREAAREVRRLFDEHGVRAMPKTTGNRGIHIYVRLQPRWTSYEVRSAAVAAAPTRADDRRLVEGGARETRIHRLQPERAAQDDFRRVVGEGPTGRAGLDSVSVGGAGLHSARRADDCLGARALARLRRSMG
jgi:DNA primase